MLINERKPLGTDVFLESDLLERELENGVIVEQYSPVDEGSGRSIFGGLVTSEEHISVREADFTRRRRRVK